MTTTYNLNSSSLITLLQSTMEAQTFSLTYGELNAAGLIPSGSGTLYTGTDSYNSGPNPYDFVNLANDTLVTGNPPPQTSPTPPRFELLTTPQSTLSGSTSFPTMAGSGNFNYFEINNNVSTVVATGDQNANVVDISSTQGNNVTNTLIGGAGREALNDFSGHDYMFAGTGLNTLYGGQGGDTMYGGGKSLIEAGTGNQYLATSNLNTSSDVLIGGQGMDTLVAQAGANYLQAGTGPTQLQAGSGNDTLNLSSGSATVFGSTNSMGGATINDTMTSAAGNTTLYGGAGKDTMNVGSSGFSDSVQAGSGTLTINASGSTLLAGPTSLTTGAKAVVLQSASGAIQSFTVTDASSQAVTINYKGGSTTV